MVSIRPFAASCYYGGSGVGSSSLGLAFMLIWKRRRGIESGRRKNRQKVTKNANYVAGMIGLKTVLYPGALVHLV